MSIFWGRGAAAGGPRRGLGGVLVPLAAGGGGSYTIASRAFDADGEAQRMEEDPAVRGHFNQTRVKWRRVVVPGPK